MRLMRPGSVMMAGVVSGISAEKRPLSVSAASAAVMLGIAPSALGSRLTSHVEDLRLTGP